MVEIDKQVLKNVKNHGIKRLFSYLRGLNKERTMCRACYGLLLLICLFSCRQEYDHKGKTPLVEVEGEFLYKEDLQSALPVGLSADDSLLFAEHYIRNWIEDELLFRKAQRNIPDGDLLQKQVENYRKALIVHSYQQALIQQQLSGEITDAELTAFYEKNKELFKLEWPIIKGLFIKVPLQVADLGKVRQWYRSQAPEAIEQLEKYSLRGAVKYEYFYDRWLTLSDIASMMPLPVDEADARIQGNIRQIEVKDTAFCYFLNVSEYLGIGAQEPEELAREEARSMLINLKQVQFFRKVKEDLYHQAERSHRIVYFNQP